MHRPNLGHFYTHNTACTLCISHHTSHITHHTLVDFSFRNSRLSRLHSSRAVTNMLYLRLIASSMYQYNSRLLPSFPLGRSCRKLNSNGSYYLQF